MYKTHLAVVIGIIV